MTRTAARPADAVAPTDTADRTAVAELLTRLPRVVDLLAARAEEHDRDATFPYQGIEAVHEAGLLTLTVSRRNGGPGGTLSDTVGVLAELGRGDASVALLTALTLLHHADQARTGRWPAAVHRRLLTESRRGPALVNPLGGDPAGATARWDGDGWLLTGRLPDCAGAEALAWLVVRARTDEPVPRTGTFLVRGDSPGVEVDPVSDRLGLRAAAGHDVVLDEVRAAAEAGIRLDPPGGPAAEDATARAWRDLALAAVLLGVARSAQHWLIRFLNRPAPGDPAEPTAALPRHRTALGELETTLIGAEELVHGLAARVDRGDATAAARAGGAQLLVNRTVTAAVQQAVALTGNPGLSRRHPLERYLRDALSGRAYFAAEETVLDELGRSALRLR